MKKIETFSPHTHTPLSLAGLYEVPIIVKNGEKMLEYTYV